MMAWIESHDELPTHPKTLKAARRLKVSVPQVIGHLHVLWYWCLTHAPDGRLEGMDADDVADAAGWVDEGEPFVKALLVAGWLDDDAGTLVIHDWWDGAGKTIKRRRYATKRQRRARDMRARDAEVAVDTDDGHTEQADTSRDSHADVTRDTQTGHGADSDSDSDSDRGQGQEPDGGAGAPHDWPRVHGDTPLTDRIVAWARSHGHVRQVETRADITRWCLDLAADHLGDTPRFTGAAVQLVVEWVERMCGEPLAPPATKHLVRVLNAEGPRLTFTAMETAVTSGAGLSEGYADDPQALVRYARSCIARWRAEGQGRIA